MRWRALTFSGAVLGSASLGLGWLTLRPTKEEERQLLGGAKAAPAPSPLPDSDFRADDVPRLTVQAVATQRLRERGCRNQKAALPWMRPEETELLATQVLKIQSRRVPSAPLTYLEFGTGGSTTTVPQFFDRSFSFEHYDEWFKEMIAKESVRCLMQKANLTVALVNGPGYIKDRLYLPYRINATIYEGYYAPFENLKNAHNVSHYDFVLIDGRFRVIVALNLLPYIDKHSTVLVHDYSRYARDLSRFYQVRHAAGRMAALRKRQVEENASEAVVKMMSDQFSRGRYVW